MAAANSYPGIVLTATRPSTNQKVDTAPFSMSIAKPDLTVGLPGTIPPVKIGAAPQFALTVRLGNVALPIPGVDFTYKLNGTPPVGLSLDAATGLFTGAALGPAGASEPLTISVTGPGVTRVSPPFTLEVAEGAAVVLSKMECLGYNNYCTTDPVPSVELPFLKSASDYKFTSPDAVPGTFRIASGLLPDGITMDADGRLRGSSTAPGSYPLGVAAQGAGASAPMTITIGDDPRSPRLCSQDMNWSTASSLIVGGSSQQPPTGKDGEVFALKPIGHVFHV
jgi:hypothetical protein